VEFGHLEILSVAKFLLDPGILILPADKLSKFLSNPRGSEAVHFLPPSTEKKIKHPQRGDILFSYVATETRSQNLY